MGFVIQRKEGGYDHEVLECPFGEWLRRQASLAMFDLGIVICKLYRVHMPIVDPHDITSFKRGLAPIDLVRNDQWFR